MPDLRAIYSYHNPVIDGKYSIECNQKHKSNNSNEHNVEQRRLNGVM